MYRLRYRVLEAGTTPRNAAACLAVLLGSYIFSAFINAATVTQPALTGPRSHAVIVSPRVLPASDDLPTEIPDPAPEPGPQVDGATSRRL